MSNQKENFQGISAAEFKDIVFKRPRFAVVVDIYVADDVAKKLESMSKVVLVRNTHRKTSIYVRDFNVNTPNTFNFVIETEIPPCLERVMGESHVDYGAIGKLIATTFPDFCWMHAEGTTPLTVGEVRTKIREDAELGDLTWHLPSKFADDLIETMHCLNLDILEGVLQDSVLYGPILN
jgi:hypothetical protein